MNRIDGEVEVIEDSATGLLAVVTSDPDDYCLEGDRWTPERCTWLFRHTVISMLPAFVEERYMEDPGAWGDEWLENPPIYEAADM